MSARDAEAEYLRTAFLERLAHELRGPVGVISGGLQELESSLGGDAAQYAQLFALARRGVRRIVRLADRLQQTGQFERGGVTMDRVRADVATLLHAAAREAETLEGRRGVKLQLDVPAVPVYALVDARWVSLAIYELTSNALRHARALVTMTLDLTGDQVTISVRDDKPHPAAFGPTRFSTTPEHRGLGLSLALVRDVAAAHGGKLEIGPRDVQPPCGSEVRLILPCERI